MSDITKLNIHLSLDQEAQRFCREVNAGIRSIVESTIIFDENSPMIPHITLVMGELSPSCTLADLSLLTTSISKRYFSLKIRFGKPYVENHKNTYIFMDAEHNHELLELRRDFAERALGSHLLSSEKYSETPHLTLANIRATEKEAVGAYLQSLQPALEVVCNAIEISHVGPKGTCIDSIFIIPLKTH